MIRKTSEVAALCARFGSCSTCAISSVAPVSLGTQKAHLLTKNLATFLPSTAAHAVCSNTIPPTSECRAEHLDTGYTLHSAVTNRPVRPAPRVGVAKKIKSQKLSLVRVYITRR